MHFTVMVSGKRVEVTLSRAAGRIEATIAGRTYTLDAMPVEPGVYWLNSADRSFEVTVVESAAGYDVSVGGRRIPVEIEDPRKALRRSTHGGHDGAVEIRAPMPGKIVRVLVQEAATVEANQGVAVMEAMKMQNEIKSPKPGKVLKVGVTDGAAVNAGDLIAVVE